jgi:hypothetical protein
MSVEPEGNILFVGISYAMLREGYTADEIIEFWQLEDEEQISSIVDGLNFNEDTEYLNEDTEVSDEYYFSQIEYIGEGILKTLQTAAQKTLSKAKWSQNLGKWLQGGRTTRIPKPRNPTATQLKPKPPGSKNPTRQTGGSTGPNTKPTTARGPGGKPVRNKPTRTKPSSSPTTGGGNWFSRNPLKTAALGAGAGIVAMNALTGGGSDKEGEKTGQGTKDDPVILQRNPDGSLTQVTPKKDDGNYSVSSQTGADQRPKSPLDTNPYFDNPGLKSYWNIRAKQVKQKAMDGSRNLRNHVEKKDDEIVIIEYLLNNGHADTVEEAVYVFTQLDEDYIASILNENV